MATFDIGDLIEGFRREVSLAYETTAGLAAPGETALTTSALILERVEIHTPVAIIPSASTVRVELMRLPRNRLLLSRLFVVLVPATTMKERRA